MTRRSIDDVLTEHTGEGRPSAKTARKASAEIRNRADRLGKAAVSDQLMADATRLDEYASGLELDATAKELGVGESNSPVKLGDPEAKATPKKAAGKAAARRKGSTRKRRSRVGSAVRQAAVDEPAEQVAGAVRSGGSIFWTFALGTVVLVLIYNLIANGDRAAKLIDAAGNGAARVAYPKTAFPERYTDARPLQGPPAPASGPARKPRQLVPVANPRTTNSRSTRT